MERLLEPFQLSFMQSALAGALLVGLTCATLGVYVVLRRMAFIGDAVAHSTMPGLVIAYLHGWNLSVSALVTAMVAALGIGWIARRGTLREDTAIGVVFTGVFALGIVMISATRSYRDITGLLFGNVLAVTSEALLIIGLVAVVVGITLGLLHKELELASFDPVQAHLVGFHPDLLRYVLLALLALAVVVGIQAVGVVLVVGLLVMPAAAASLLAFRVLTMMLIASGVAGASAVLGLYAAYFLNVAPGPSIVLACAGFFLVAMAVHSLRPRSVQGS